MPETHQIASDHVDEIKARCTLFGLSPGPMEAHVGPPVSRILTHWLNWPDQCADFTEDPNAAKILQKADVVVSFSLLSAVLKLSIWWYT